MLERLVKGELNNYNALALAGPPGSSKSTMTNHYFSAWFLGWMRHVEKKAGNAILATNTKDIAAHCGMLVRDIIKTEGFNEIFPGMVMSKDANAKGEMHLLSESFGKGRWEYSCTGVKGIKSGRRADLLVMDDPYKNKSDLLSPAKRKEIADIFRTVALTRLTGKKIKLLMHTRWGREDLIGEYAEHDPNWTYLNLPVTALDHEEYEIHNPIYQRIMRDIYGKPYYFRVPGESIWPNHPDGDFSEEQLEQKKAMLTRDEYQALFMGKPVVDGGNMIKTDCFRLLSNVPKLQYTIMTADTAWAKGDKNSYSVFQLWGKFEEGAILLRQLRGRWEYGELKRKTQQFFFECQNDFGTIRKLAIEKEASGIGLLTELSNDTLIPIEPIVVKASGKVLRLNEVMNFIEKGRVWIYNEMGDIDAFLEECQQFPEGAHNDQVDTMVHGLKMIFVTGTSIYDSDAWIG